MVKIITATKSGPIPTFKYLNDIVAILGSTKAFLWPFLESNGLLIQSYDNEDESLVPGNAGTPKSLDDAAAGFHPFKHVGGVHSYHFEAGNDQHLAGADAATLSFGGTTDAAFSVGCWFYIDSGTGTLMAKYDVAGTDREWRLDLAAGPDLRFTVFDDSADANTEEGAQCTTALSTRQWYFGVATYGGAGGNGSSPGDAADDVAIYIDGAVVTDTNIEDVNYDDMVGGAAPLMIGATDDAASPASEFTGRIALPFICGKELTAANVSSLYDMGKMLLGLA